MTLSFIIIRLGLIFLIVNTLLFTLSNTKKNKVSKYFILYLALCFFVQIFSSILSELSINNLYLSHYFFIGQFIFLSLFFASLPQYKKFKKIILLLTVIIPLPFIFYYYNNLEVFKKWNVFEIAFTSIPLLIYSFYFFIKKIDGDKNKKYIYFNSGFFLYTLCSTLIFTLGNIGSRQLKLFVWDINASLYLIFQILILVEWFVNFRKIKLLYS